VSVGFGKAEIKHQGKWVVLDPRKKFLPLKFFLAPWQWGLDFVRMDTKKVDQWNLFILMLS
jgi:hypothetical protein